MTCFGPVPSDSSSFFRQYFGFVPRVFQAQSALPRVVDAEAEMAASILSGGTLSQIENERIVLATASARRNVYWATLSYQTLAVLGVTGGELDGIMSGEAWPYRDSTEQALLVTAWANFVCAIATGLAVEPDFDPVAIPDCQPRVLTGLLSRDVLKGRSAGVETALIAELTQCGAVGRERQIIEAVISGALAAFWDPAKLLNPLRQDPRPTEERVSADPDAELVARVQQGDVDGFEEIMERHSRRVYRTLIGVLGDPEQARDAMQDTFLKAYQHISGFQGRSKFSTWLVSIASNTAIQMLRDRCPEESLERDDSDETYRPKEFRAWSDDPEQSYAKAELKELVEEKVMKLPPKYRVVVMLKDIEQLSIEEVGSALGLGTAAVKSRVLRGRLMMREALAPHFTRSARGGVA
jgi:RNA polymerase sigma-70 factor (ECF subfamily)